MEDLIHALVLLVDLCPPRARDEMRRDDHKGEYGNWVLHEYGMWWDVTRWDGIKWDIM